MTIYGYVALFWFLLFLAFVASEVVARWTLIMEARKRGK